MDKLDEMQEKFSQFIRERDWEQFHNPKDLAIALSIESNELLEHFQWKSYDEIDEVVEKHKKEISSEVADVFHFLMSIAKACDIDLYEAFMEKLEKNEQRYPKDLVRGKTDKYTHYQQ
jgi:NTP pyrophosphatase (non-canonical NTP hydrolase)